MEKPLKHQRRLGLICGMLEIYKITLNKAHESVFGLCEQLTIYENYVLNMNNARKNE